jgi:hypothetical protein
MLWFLRLAWAWVGIRAMAQPNAGFERLLRTIITPLRIG